MKQSEKFLRFVLTAAVFGLVIYAFTIIWSPQNIERLFKNIGSNSRNTLISHELERYEKGPKPIITFDAVQHIVERHVDNDTFPEKSKFVDGVDIPHLIEMTYSSSTAVRQEDDKFIYECANDVFIGSRGQRCIRLVTASDGTVITLYPIFEIEEARDQAA